MALRCERCRTAELTLVSFGVYQCPNCGRVDADGNVLDETPGQDRADSTQPTILETGRASFAAPPPAAAPPGVASAPSALLTPVAHAPGGAPTVFLVTLAATALLDVVNALVTHTGACGVTLVLFYACLLTGKRWARTLSLALAVLTIGVCAMAFVALHGAPASARASMIVAIVANAWWMYVLLRPDTVRYFSR